LNFSGVTALRVAAKRQIELRLIMAAVNCANPKLRRRRNGRERGRE
jgi:hypothetical protein